jgi:hypothetical protein
MIVRSFRSSEPLNIIFLLCIVFLLRLIWLLQDIPAPFIQYSEPFSRFLLNDVAFLQNRTFNTVLAGLVIFTQGLWLNRLVFRYNILLRNSYLPGLMYVILMSLFSSFLPLNAPLLANYFLLMILDKLFGIHKSSRSIPLLFDTGMLVSLATLFYFPAILWLLMIWLTLMFFKPFVWREYLVGIIGFLIPYLFVALFYFWKDNLSGFLDMWAPLRNRLSLDLFRLNLNDFIPLLPATLILLLAVNKFRSTFYKNIIQVRKYHQLLILLTLISTVAYYIRPLFGINHFILLGVPMAIFLSYYFLIAKKAWLSESLLLLLILSILYFQLF